MKFAPILLSLVGVASSEFSTGENIVFDTQPTGSTSPADNIVSLPTIPARSDPLEEADLQHVAMNKGKKLGNEEEHTKRERKKKNHNKKTDDNKETEDDEDNEETEDIKKESKKARKDKKVKEDRVDDGMKKKRKDKKQSDKKGGRNKVAQPAETLSPSMSDHGASSTSPTTKPITPSPTKRPVTPSPTKSPVTPPPTTRPTTPVVPTTGAPTVDPEFLLLLSKLPHAYPYTRFTPWMELESSEEAIATNLGYNEDLWDNLERHDLEGEIFDDLSSTNKQNAALLGMDGNIWDCYMNHYGGLYWEDMVAEGVDQYWAKLGWDQEGWDEGGNDPDTEDMYWSDLSEEQKEAAHQLCFFDLSWDWVKLPCWSQPQLCED